MDYLMDCLISLAIHVGKLEARIEFLESALNGKTQEKTPHFKAEEDEIGGDTERAEEERQAEQRFQEGIDNILGYEWPVRKEKEHEG